MHFIKFCVICEKVISQCKCPYENKAKQYGVCDTCKELYCNREHLEDWEVSVFIGKCSVCDKPFLPAGKLKG